MRCTSPKTVGFLNDGKTLTFSPKHYSKEFAPFQIPCRKCLSCRLEAARETAVRCVHEAQMYEKNSFITLTYSDENLKSSKLDYKHYQKFIKDLRNHLFQDLLNSLFPKQHQSDQRKLWNKFSKERRNELYESIKISALVAGEYGDKTKRPHWHILVFNWRPSDTIYKYQNERGDKVFTSNTLDTLWKNGLAEIGTITFQSAGYVARYASKKLIHGKDGEHEYEPISKRSTKNAIGKKWIQKFYNDVFNYGYVVLLDGTKCGIPKYYEKWFKKIHPEKWMTYVTTTKQKIMQEAREKEARITLQEKKAHLKRSSLLGLATRAQARDYILKQKFNNLQKYHKF